MNKFAVLLAGLGLAGLSLTAHALCVNPDGSLDDPSVTSSTVATDMLPTCQGAPTGGKAAQPVAATRNDQPAIAASGVKAHAKAGKPDPKY